MTTANVCHIKIERLSDRGRGKRTGSDEELGSVGVLSGVGHGEETRLGVLQLEVFIYVVGFVQEAARTDDFVKTTDLGISRHR